MLFLTVATLLTSALAASSNNRLEKRQTAASAAAAAALKLNSSVAYQICIISQGAFAAAAALGSKATFQSCDSINPFSNNPSAQVLTSTLQVSGCQNATSGVSACQNQYLASGAQLYPISAPVKPTTFVIPTTNGLCSGVASSFYFQGVTASAFTANLFSVSCTTGVVSLANGQHFCVGTDPVSGNMQLQANPSANTCSTTYVLTFTALTPGYNPLGPGSK